MKSKSSVVTLLSTLVVLIVYCVCMLILSIPRTAIFWTAFCFTIAALILEAIVGILALRTPAPMKSRFLKVPILYVSTVYTALQLAWGIVCIAASIDQIICTIASTILLGVCLLMLIALPLSEATVSRIDAYVHSKTQYIQSMQLKLSLLTAQCPDPALKGELEALAEAVRFSDPMSDDSLSPLEADIQGRVSRLETLVSTDTGEALAVCHEIRDKLIERNGTCKLLK